MMRRMLLTAAGLMASGGIASGEMVHWSSLVAQETLFDASSRALFTVDVSGMASWDFQGDPDNEIVELFIGGAIPIGIEWDLYITTVGVSWADEVTIGIADESFAVNPAFGDSFTVSNMNYQGSHFGGFSGSLDGILEIEFYETGFDDNPDGIDAYFEAGSTITVIFPAPGTLAILGFGGFCVSRRQRD